MEWVVQGNRWGKRLERSERASEDDGVRCGQQFRERECGARGAKREKKRKKRNTLDQMLTVMIIDDGGGGGGISGTETAAINHSRSSKP
jgi:hypothetical protein